MGTTDQSRTEHGPIPTSIYPSPSDEMGRLLDNSVLLSRRIKRLRKVAVAADEVKDHITVSHLTTYDPVDAGVRREKREKLIAALDELEEDDLPSQQEGPSPTSGNGG